jgi:hypothetical protein
MKRTFQKITVLAVILALGAGCSMMSKGGSSATLNATNSGGGGSSSGGGGGGDTGGGGNSGGGGTTVAANQISSSVPNDDSVVARIQNALIPTGSTTSAVSSLKGNFATALTQQGPNLSSTSNPVTATGASANSLLAYAACNDAPAATFGVTTTSSATSQQTNLINAGLEILNTCTANLAASGTSLNTQATTIFQTLLASNAAPTSGAAATTAQDFISVCTAAVSVCVSMLSF